MRKPITQVLTPMQKLAVTRKGNGETRAEIARSLGVSKQAVKKLWSRARHRALANMEPAEVALYDVQFGKPRTVHLSQLKDSD